MFLLGGDYGMFPRVRLLQKISSLAQLLPFQSLPQILDPSLRFVDPLDVSYPRRRIFILSYESFSPKDRAYLMSVQSSHEPESFAEASNHSCWRDAIQEKKNAQEKKNKTSVSLPAGKQAIGCKWIYIKQMAR